ncbi:hypothetical protein B723_22225 [Pseudomonas fluorescens NCIMB 11764]|uniref:Uncharacterized protein n=1 Tax=Pseudomonas fluorescens NCIMB 11764 TaxID=1221522 RepID=A0A0K1QTB7_PSEFL|nr:hypothetical protein B723_22225 [Pseudomonas fluorescens NCIMB 11764]
MCSSQVGNDKWKAAVSPRSEPPYGQRLEHKVVSLAVASVIDCKSLMSKWLITWRHWMRPPYDFDASAIISKV